MINWRVKANLVAFFIGSLILIGYGFSTFIGNPFKPPIVVSSTFPNASGLYQNFTVTLNGVDVGSVKNVTLTKSGAKVTMIINSGVDIPSNVVATIGIANALGEQEVDLSPTSNTNSLPLKNGATIPVGPNSVPAEIGTLVTEATSLLQKIPPQQLNSLLQQLSIAISGHVNDMRSIIENSQLFSQEFLNYQNQFKAFLENAPPVLNAVSSVGPQLNQSLANTAALLQLLSAHRYDLVSLLQNGASAASLLNSLVVSTRPNLACLTHDLGNVMSNLSTAPNFSNLGSSLALNQQFFGPIDSISPFGPAISLNAGDVNRNNQEWLRSRLLLPPMTPSASSYSTPVKLPPVLGGPGCITNFGPGVGPATQPGFKPAGPSAVVIPSSYSDYTVKGSGPSNPGSMANSAYDTPLRSNGKSGLIPLAILTLLALTFFTWLKIRRNPFGQSFRRQQQNQPGLKVVNRFDDDNIIKLSPNRLIENKSSHHHHNERKPK